MLKDLKEYTKSKMFIFVSNLISQRMKGKMTLRLHFSTKTFSDMSYSDEKIQVLCWQFLSEILMIIDLIN